MGTLTNLERTQAHFQTTRWSLVARLHHGDEADRSRAFEDLARTYWPPVYAYLRAKGLSRDAASESTQAFFADVVIGRELIATAHGGRLRALVRTAVQRYVIDLARRERVRGGDQPKIPINPETADTLVAAAAGIEPDAAFEKSWATAIVREAARRCEAHFRDTGKPGHWEAFEAQVFLPICAHVAPVPLAQLAARFNTRTPADIGAWIQVVRKRFQTLIQEVAAETADSEPAARDEYDAVRLALGS
ncbi:hypothetical protein PHYC_00818 [Phycisphaerales bacterium]|nr:hypothetical protein PHYC_00818 [Phycisphaerales bacterium]